MRHAILAILGSLAMAVAACTAPGLPASSGQSEPDLSPVAAPSPPPGPPALQTTTVRRGSITDVVSTTGRVTDGSEVGLTFPLAVRVANVAADAGQTVDEGQLLMEADTTSIQSDLAAARTRRDQAQARVDNARAALDTRLRRASEAFDRLTAPPSEADRLAAQGAVVTARAALRRAEADLAKLTAPPSPIEIQAADQEVATAELGLQKAEADLAKLKQGPDPAEVRKAEIDMATAQGAYARAQDAYRALVKGPDQFDLRAAERTVAEAEENLRVAQRTKPVPVSVSTSGGNSSATRAAREQAAVQQRNAQIQYEANVRRAEFALETAQDRLAKASQGPTRADIDAAIRAVESAKRQLDDADARRAELFKDPSPLDVQTAEAAVANARANVNRAQSRRDAWRAGPSSADLSAAQASIETARTTVATAEARYNELVGPDRIDTPEVRDARSKVATLQQILDAPPDKVDAVATGVGRDDKDLADAVQAYQDALRGLTDEQRRVAAQESSLAASRLVAPFPGVVTAVLAHVGDSTRPGRPAVLVARGTDPLVRAEISTRDAARVAVGQQAVVETSDAPSARVPATVSDVSAGENERGVTLSAAWGSRQPAFGSTAQIVIAVQQKDDVLIVAQRAIRVVGTRRFIDLVEGTATRRVEVEVGVTSGSDVEVIGPLREGQQVLIVQ